MAWSGYMRKEDSKEKRTIMELRVKGRKGRGRPNKRWLKVVKCYMRTAGVCMNDRVKWKLRTKIGDSK